MPIYVYLFSLIVGGILLAASIFLGGDHGDSDGDLGADADADADADAGFDADGVDGAHDLHVDQDIDTHGAPFLIWALTSLRFWTFFLAFFGLTGLVFQGTGLIGSWLITLGLSIGMGSLVGYLATGAIRWLSRDQSGQLASSGDYVGKSARVLVPVNGSSAGKVRLQLKGSTVDVLAISDEGESFETQEEALIIDMDGTQARIARIHPGKK